MRESKFLALPLHHIDTSVILEDENTNDGKLCKKYLNRLNLKYRGKLSLPVTGELFIKLVELKTFNEQYNNLKDILDLIEDKKVTFYVPWNTEKLVDMIKEIDSRISETDAQILACAVEDKALTLVTLDKKLINNCLGDKLGIKILHPSDL